MPADGTPLPLSLGQLLRLDSYARLVAGWREGNVSGVRDAAAVRRTLVEDALALLDVDELRAPRDMAAGGGDSASVADAADRRWADLGAGAGIPGIPLAVACPDVRIILIEAAAKKCRFLRRAIEVAGVTARAEVVCARSEAYAAVGAPGREAVRVVLARAVGPLPTVVELAAPLLAEGGVLLVSSSGDRAAAELGAGEVAARRCGLAVARVQPLSGSPLDDSVCVVVCKVATVPEWLPRRPGRARTHPLVDSSVGVGPAAPRS